MKVVYVAGPFRGPNAWETEENIRRAERLALQVWRAGAAALCPHTNTRFFQGAAADQIWLDGDLELLRRCDAMILTPNWRESSGARAEHDFACIHGLHVFHDIADLAAWLDEFNREPPDPDGEAHRGTEAAGFAREQQADAMRLK